MPVYVGIDPGFSGGLALYDPSNDWLEIHDCPLLKVNGKSEMCLPAIIDILGSVEVAGCVIERSHSMPKQGVASTFAYGVGYGSYLGMLASLKIPHTKISPQEWKKKMRVPSDKDGARARASELMPVHSSKWLLKKHHGRAEAALLALFCASAN